MSQTEVQLFMREFETLTDAHVFASKVSQTIPDDASSGAGGFRWIDISATARGAWICGVVDSSIDFKFEIIRVQESSLKALLSLGDKPNPSIRSVGIIEGTDIAQVIRSADFFSKKVGYQLLEIRIKRTGTVPGAYAYLALDTTLASGAEAASQKRSDLLPMIEVPLVGDYRRFFI